MLAGDIQRKHFVDAAAQPAAAVVDRSDPRTHWNRSLHWTVIGSAQEVQVVRDGIASSLNHSVRRTHPGALHPRRILGDLERTFACSVPEVLASPDLGNQAQDACPEPGKPEPRSGSGTVLPTLPPRSCCPDGGGVPTGPPRLGRRLLHLRKASVARRPGTSSPGP